MVRSPLRRTASALLVAVGLAALPAAASADTTQRYIVVFEKSSAPAARAATADIADDENFTPSQRYDDALHGFAARLDKHDLAAVRDDPRVAEVVPDRPVTATALVSVAAGDNIPAGVRRVGGAVGTTVHQASTANVAVIDTGVDLSHPDLNAVAGTNCNGTGAPTDGNGHGTHVAGTIGAKNQGSGAVGVAPGTKIFAVKVLNAQGSGYASNIICGIDWVTSTRTDADPSNDIAVANMSLGGGNAPNANCGRTVNDPEHIAICNSTAAGVTYVVAAGNSTADEQTFSPANYPEVLTVTSVSDSDGLPGGVGGNLSCINNGDDQPASYSNYATRSVDVAHTIAAPGSCIRSTAPGGGYATMSGTSMASPHVAGLVALCEGEAGAHGPCCGQTPATVASLMLAAASSTAAAAPGSVFNGSPGRPIAGKYYGDMASTAFPSTSTSLPINTAVPAITGTASTLSTLTATTGTWTGSGTLTYTTQWLRCTSTALNTCTDIAGATSSTYAPASADVARYLRVRVVATNDEGSGMVRSAATAAVVSPVAPASVSALTLTGTAMVGKVLTGKNGGWSGTAPISYAGEWERCETTLFASCTAISGATSTTYTVVSADVGKRIRYAVTATNARSSVIARSAATAAVVAAPVPVVVAVANTVLPSMVGTARVGSSLSARIGTWSGTSPTYAYQWLRCTTTAVGSCSNIAGATAGAYVLTADDRARYVRLAVTATNSKGSVTAKSNVLGLIG